MLLFGTCHFPGILRDLVEAASLEQLYSVSWSHDKDKDFGGLKIDVPGQPFCCFLSQYNRLLPFTYFKNSHRINHKEQKLIFCSSSFCASSLSFIQESNDSDGIIIRFTDDGDLAR